MLRGQILPMDIRTETGVEAQQISAQVERELLSALGDANQQAVNSSIVLSARDDSGKLIGGITASTSYGWLLIKTLWVRDEHRGAGIGRLLVEKMQDCGKDADCHAAWLDTSNLDAKYFYARLGYEVFGTLENIEGQFPAGHKRWFMKKNL
ncbi:MAG: GNAT family N-acetyltransferase [Pseudomonadota bacterium]